MPHKKNVVLYLDAELVEKTRELGFNMSKTCENHLKQLITQFSTVNSVKNCGKCVIGSPGEIRTLVSGSRAQDSIMINNVERTIADFWEYLKVEERLFKESG